MTELVDNSERKRNDTQSDYAPFYFMDTFSFFPINNTLHAGRCLGRKALLFKISLSGAWNYTF